MTASHGDVTSYVIRLGRATDESVEPARRDLHLWLAASLGSRPTPQALEPRIATLSFQDVHTQAASINDLIAPAETLPEDETVVFDLSATSYGLLREPLLAHVARAAAKTARNAPRTVVILMTRKPNEGSSLLWDPLKALEDAAGTIVLVDGKGATRQFGRRLRIPDGFREEYAQRQAGLTIPTRQRFEEKLVRRLGHFDAAPLRGAQRCGRFFYDASKCVDEVADLLAENVRSVVDLERLTNATLIIAPGHATWMEEAGLLCAGRLGMRSVVLPDPVPSDMPPAVSETCNVVALGVVNTGRSLGRVLTALERWGGPVVHAVAALTARWPVPVGDRDLSADALRTIALEEVARDDCPQCAIGRPFSHYDAAKEPLVSVTAYDFWSMALRAPWEEETYGPSGTPRFERTPSLDEVFDKYGDWIASVYDRLLDGLGLSNEVVVISPDEPAVGQLVKRLRARFEARLVPIAIPREVLDDAKAYRHCDTQPTVAERAPGWQEQLRGLESGTAQVVTIDEFSASGSTQAAMARILEAHGIRVEAHLPFVDRAGHQGTGPVIGLYELSSARR